MISHAQGYRIPDSLNSKTYDYLYKSFLKVNRDTTKSLIYLNSYLQKGKDENEKFSMAMGYSLISSYQKKDKVKLHYLDSSISISKNLNNSMFPALPYSLKAGHYHFKQNFRKALSNLFLSLEAAKKNKNEHLIYTAKNNISLIKSKLGKYDEAIKGFKECLNYHFDEKIGIRDTTNFLFVTLDISETYTKKNMLDSSSLFIKKGIEVSKQIDNDQYNFFHLFLFNEGVNQFHKKNYQIARDNIESALPFISTKSDKNYVLNAYLYLGKIYSKLNKEDNAREHYQRVDSIYQVTGNVSSEIREAYNALVEYYKDKKDIKNQLLYIEKLLQFDSVLQSDYKELNEILVKQYDTPQLLAEKERLVQEATIKSSRYGVYIIILIGSVMLFVGLFGYQFYRRRLYQRRFEVLTLKKNTNPEPKQDKSAKKKEANAEDIGISESIVQEVLFKLQEFEDGKGFRSTKITLTELSSELGTNNKYLSKIINVYKEKSFSQYINDLRIDYIIERLQEDKKLRNYTIKAIARETGFNTAEVFSKAFYGKHGIYPSYFIKKLNKT